jgi:uncharacterized protein YjiS (DUF1127 family)
MTARFARDQMSFVMPASLSDAAGTRRTVGKGGLVPRFAAVIDWILELPRRRAVIAELSALSDHELADIGLARNEVARVFDPAFTASRPAAR